MVKEKGKHFTIPVFIPLAACPFQCIFCDQTKISGKAEMPSDDEIRELIERNLATFPEDSHIEAGFFGGTFTGLPEIVQRHYLDLIIPYIKSGNIESIRLSTRPDFIDDRKLDLLSEYPVKTIELGIQSFDDEVLKKAGRGHTSEDSVKASELIRSKGFNLGLQMMVGLPGDSPEKVKHTAEEIVRLGASETRIYPLLVIKGTALEKMFLSGKYQPLSLEQAVEWTKAAMEVFEDSDVKVIRVGLHHSDTLMEKGYIAGPVHVSLKELVMSRIWQDKFSLLKKKKGNYLEIRVNPADFNNAVGYGSLNKNMLKEFFSHVKFIADKSIPEKSFYADHH